MYSRRQILLFCINLLCFAITLINGSNDQERKLYIVYMGELPENAVSLEDIHHNLLVEAIGNEYIARESKIHSYGRSFNALAARLLPHEAKILSENENVVSVFASQIRQLRTTRSWDFLGMPMDVTRNQIVESNTIVGLIDTGIYMQSPSFNDSGYGPPPAKWKGKCMKGINFPGCNNKVIGAQYSNLANLAIGEEEATPADSEGHGSHTASTFAGISVPGISYYGLLEGTARGGVPSARIAMYKACYFFGCGDVDILASFDSAIADGVDLLSVSLGAPSRDYFSDGIAIGAFHAMKKGILVACAAGNDGPFLNTIENVAPWILTVAASTDRKFETMVELGNGMKFIGTSLDPIPMKKMHPLISGAIAATNEKTELAGKNASTCDPWTLNAKKLKGRIVFCREQDYSVDPNIQRGGAVGTIISTASTHLDTADAQAFPSATVSINDGDLIDSYINSTKEPKALIHMSREWFIDPSKPLVASFSSRGPQNISLNILKPDITAPGVSILASISALNWEGEFFIYKTESGTSMSTPHAMGAAAYIKSFHPNWSPSAIKSAIMTTAKPFKEVEPAGAELGYGSGLINPTKALHPGLIYDMNEESYISFLCKEGYSIKNITKLSGKKVNCSSLEPAAKGTDGLNYPSMHIQLQHNITKFSAVFHRTVTYVEQGKTVFRAKIQSPKTLSITVSPNTLAFSKPYQKKSFSVTLEGKFVGKIGLGSSYISASLVWIDRLHSVSSPIFVYRQPSA